MAAPNLRLNLPVRRDSGTVAQYYQRIAEEDDDDYASSYGGTEWDDGATTSRTMDGLEAMVEQPGIDVAADEAPEEAWVGHQRAQQAHQMRAQQPLVPLTPLREDQPRPTPGDAKLVGPFSSGLNRHSVGRGGRPPTRDSISAASGGSFMGYVEPHGGDSGLRMSNASNVSGGSASRASRRMKGPVLGQSASQRDLSLPTSAARPGGGDMFFAGSSTPAYGERTPGRRGGLESGGAVAAALEGGGGGGAADFQALPTPLRGGPGHRDFRRATLAVMGALGGSRGGRSAAQPMEHADGSADYYDAPRAGDQVEPGTPSVGARTPGREWDPELEPPPGAASTGGGMQRGEEGRHASQMTELEVTRHYERIEAEVREESGGIPLARLRDPTSHWNGGRPPLTKLTRAGRSGERRVKKGANGTAAVVEEPEETTSACYLSRNYTEGMRCPTAFVAPPPAFVLCQVCRDVAWEPVRDAMYNNNLVFCRVCLCIAQGDEYGMSVEEDAEVTNVIMGLRILCRNALVGSRTQQGMLVWRMDNSGCPETARLGDRHLVEAKCTYAMEECGLPRGANPADCCRRRVRRRNMMDHREECDHRLVLCKFEGCSRRTQARYAANHARLCEQRPFVCPHRPRCKWQGKRVDLEAHLQDCDHEVIPCGYVDSFNDANACHVALPRNKMKAHRDVCQYQRAKCQFCNQLQSLRQLGQHEANCHERHYVCHRCGKTVHRHQRRVHEKSVCPNVEIECGFKKYGCAERVQRCDYAAHAKSDFHLHMRMILVHAHTDPAAAPQAGDRVDPSGQTNDDGDGLEALVTRHELTRADVRTLEKTSTAMARGFDREVAHVLEEAARVGDEAGDAAQRLALDIRATRAAAQAAIAAVDRDVKHHDQTLQDRLLVMYNDSVAMRRRAEHELAPDGYLDEAAAVTRSAFAEAKETQRDMLQEIGSALLGLTTALSPALDVRTETGAAQSGPLNACADKLATMEWHGADRALIAWERLQDICENFRAHVESRRRVCDQLEEKIDALEERRFITPEEDSELRKKKREEVIQRVRAKMTAVSKLAQMKKMTKVFGSPGPGGKTSGPSAGSVRDKGGGADSGAEGGADVDGSGDGDAAAFSTPPPPVTPTGPDTKETSMEDEGNDGGLARGVQRAWDASPREAGDE